MTALTAPTVRVPAKRQTAAERQAVYDDVTARDMSCRAWVIDPEHAYLFDCREPNDGTHDVKWWPLERHHAGNKIGSRRITDARHVVLLCSFHHRTWAPMHSRLILEWLARIEDARAEGQG